MFLTKILSSLLSEMMPFTILVFEKLRDFGLTKLEWKYLDRETKLKLEHIGVWENPAKGTGWKSLREAQLPNHATLNNG